MLSNVSSGFREEIKVGSHRSSKVNGENTIGSLHRDEAPRRLEVLQQEVRIMKKLLKHLGMVLLLVWIGSVCITLTAVCHLMPHQAAHNNMRLPPRWEPGLENALPFRTWLQDLLLWTITSDLEPHRQAAAIISQLGGAARDLARTLTPQEIFNGGVINGQHLDPVSFLIHGLSARFSPLDDEIRIRAAQDLLQFQRRGNESVDVLITRFETIRSRAPSEGGGANVSTEPASLILLRAIGVSSEQFQRLTQPFGLRLPNSEEELAQLMHQLRRMGHIIEHRPANIADSLHRNAGASSGGQAFVVHSADGSLDPSQTTWSYVGPSLPPQSSDTWEMPGQYSQSSTDWAYHVDPNVASDADSATESDDFQQHDDERDLEGLTAGEADEHLFWQYTEAKRRWRKYTRKPVRALRRVLRRKGKGKGQVKGSFFDITNALHESSYFRAKGKDTPHSSVHVRTQTLQDAMIVLDQMPPAQTHADIVELCGGEGLTTFMCHKRHLRTGANFELITGVDLTDPQAQRMVRQYLDMTKPRVAVMGPICGPFGPLGNRNRVLHHDAWLEALQDSSSFSPILRRSCSMCQLDAGRRFIAEQPFPSNLYLIEPWPEIRKHPRCLRVVFDQCHVGQSIDGMPVKKPTKLVATDEILLRRFSGKICRSEHQHIQLLGGKAAATQKWTPRMCDMIATSIRDLAIKEDKHQHQSSFPAVSTDTSDGPAGGHDPPSWRKCKGCLWRLNKFSSQHSLVSGECKYADVVPMEFECPSRQADKPRSHEGHTFEPGCRHALTSSRTGVPKGARETKAPRAARVPAHEEPTGSLRAESSGANAKAPQEDEGPDNIFDEVEPGGASSGSPPSGVLPDIPEPSADDPRRRDSVAREPPVRHAEADTQTPVLDDEWTKFDLQRALRDLHFGSPAQRRRLIRKLHLRWWHAGATTMLKLLRAAGSPKEVLELINPKHSRFV